MQMHLTRSAEHSFNVSNAGVTVPLHIHQEENTGTLNNCLLDKEWNSTTVLFLLILVPQNKKKVVDFWFVTRTKLMYTYINRIIVIV